VSLFPIYRPLHFHLSPTISLRDSSTVLPKPHANLLFSSRLVSSAYRTVPHRTVLALLCHSVSHPGSVQLPGLLAADASIEDVRVHLVDTVSSVSLSIGLAKTHHDHDGDGDGDRSIDRSIASDDTQRRWGGDK